MTAPSPLDNRRPNDDPIWTYLHQIQATLADIQAKQAQIDKDIQRFHDSSMNRDNMLSSQIKPLELVIFGDNRSGVVGVPQRLKLISEQLDDFSDWRNGLMLQIAGARKVLMIVAVLSTISALSSIDAIRHVLGALLTAVGGP